MMAVLTLLIMFTSSVPEYLVRPEKTLRVCAPRRYRYS